MSKYVVRKCPCFECADTRYPEECAIITGDLDRCIPIDEGETWETCFGGGLSDQYKHFQSPVESGYYIVWTAVPYNSVPLGLVHKSDGGSLFWVIRDLVMDEVEWEDGWTWTDIKRGEDD